MSVELIRDLLKIDQVVGKDQIEALVEGEIRLPENKPSINKILTIDGDAEVTDINISQDKVKVNGVVKFKVLYSANDEKQPIHSLDASTEFSEEIEIEGATEEMIADIKSNIEHIDFRLIDESRVSVKTVMEIEGKVQSDNNIDIIKEVTGAQGLQVLKEKIKYNDIVGTNKSSTIIKEAFELEEGMPDILDILRVDVKSYEKELKVVDDKVIVAGVVEASIMYFGDDEENQINYLSHEIPFTHFVEISGAVKDMDCNLKLQAADSYFDTKEDINGNIRIVDLESIVKIDAKVFEQREKEVTVDTYSTSKKFNVVKQEVDITENIDRAEIKEIVKGKVGIRDNDSIKNIYNLNAKPIITDYRMVEGKVIIEGLLNVNSLYLSGATEEITNVSEEIPYKFYVDIEGIDEGVELDIQNALENLNYNKKGDGEIEIEADVKTLVSINRIKKFNIVTQAEELEEDIDKKTRPSIIIYVVQKEDSLWDIAKRYNTTVEEIIETNDIASPDNIMPGEKIIIEKNIEFEL
ncbi:MAG: DUF3794 domain-containing protein [Firmicutes bacterium]|nr:DUF3794 domain-containing protein [Bacillota bacterium]